MGSFSIEQDRASAVLLVDAGLEVVPTLDRALRSMDTLLKSLDPSFTARVDEEQGPPCWSAVARR